MPGGRHAFQPPTPEHPPRGSPSRSPASAILSHGVNAKCSRNSNHTYKNSDCFFLTESHASLLPSALRSFSARHLNIELDPDFVFHPYRTAGDFHSLDVQFRLLEARAPHVMPARFSHFHLHVPGLPVHRH